MRELKSGSEELVSSAIRGRNQMGETDEDNERAPTTPIVELRGYADRGPVLGREGEV